MAAITATTTHPSARPALVLVPTQRDGSITFDELGQRWLATRRNLKRTTRISYEIKLRVQISPLIGGLDAATLTFTDMEALVAGMDALGYKPRTIRDAFTVTKTVLDYGIRHELVSSNPALLLPGRERPRITRHPVRILTANEINTLVATAPEPWRTIFAVAIFAGLRSGETRGLQWQDIDIANKRLRVRRQAALDGTLVPPKTENSVRDVALLDPLPAILERFRATHPPVHSNSCVFDNNGKPFRAPRITYKLRKLAAKAGIERSREEEAIRYHDLRHTNASILIAARSDVAFIARQLGHSSPAITLNIYAHLFDEAANIDRVRDYMNGQFAGLTGSG